MRLKLALVASFSLRLVFTEPTFKTFKHEEREYSRTFDFHEVIFSAQMYLNTTTWKTFEEVLVKKHKDKD